MTGNDISFVILAVCAKTISNKKNRLRGRKAIYLQGRKDGRYKTESCREILIDKRKCLACASLVLVHFAAQKTEMSVNCVRSLMMSRLYRMLTRAALPLAKVYLRYRAKKQPDYLKHWDERFGYGKFPTPGTAPRLWVHAVSVGETVAAKSLIAEFFRLFPESELLLTCMTPTGREIGKKILEAYPGRVKQCYLPYDTPELMGRFLDETRPKLGLIMETEVWPNLLNEAKNRSIPMILANARESEKSRRQAARFISVMRPAFSAFDLVLAQSEEDKQRLESLGAKNILVCGSVKFDIRPDTRQQEAARQLKAVLKRPIVLLASTRQGEEELFADAMRFLPKDALVWLVPRHPQRFDEVEHCLHKRGISYVRKTKEPSLESLSDSVRVVLADTMGEMSFNCALGDVCIMGGSFGNFGSQNLIEPAAAGVPVIVGPSTFNFEKPARDAIKLGAANRVGTAAEAMQLAFSWLTDGQLEERSKAAKRFAMSYTGATDKMMKEISQIWQKVR